MKKVFFICVFVIACLHGYGQTVYYGYDAAGNRTQRSINPNIILQKSTLADTSNNVEKEVFEEIIDEQKVLIYPNPTEGVLKIELQGYEKVSKTELYLYTLSGSLLMSKTPVTNFEIIDLSDYPNATYILRIVLGNQTSEWKILKK